jgi:prepilin peptidase CpaA
MASKFTVLLVVIQIGTLLLASFTDLRARLIPNMACLILAIAGFARALTLGPVFALTSCAMTAALLLLLLPLHTMRVLGGGDIKLLLSASLGLRPAGVLYLFEITALAGGVMALLHLALRKLPRPAMAPAGSSALRRIYAAERWRILRRAPLPYGVAIACGGIWTILTHTWS